MNRKVLVLDGDSRSGLAVVRSLGRKDIQVHAGWCPPDSMVPFSKYTTKTHRLPEYREDDARWLDCLINLLECEKFDLVIPATDNSMLPLVKERATLEKIAKLAVPDDGAFYRTYRKNETAELARRLEVPVPRQVLISREKDITEFDSGWKFPLVIKPVSSKVVKWNKIISLQVSYAYTKEQLFTKLQNLLQITTALVQEYFVGTSMGVELLASEGKILCAFQHVRVHEPIGGGGSSYRKSVPLNPELFDCSERLISGLKWTGVAMLEFKYNKSTDEFVLIEINPRFWGSLPLAVAAGMDFPYYLYQLLVEGKKDFSVKYKTGIHCRNLYFDFSWFLSNLFTRPSRFNNALPFWKLLYEPLNFLLLRERCDTFVLDDLGPGFKELVPIFRKIKSKLHHLFLSYWLKLPRSKDLQQKHIKIRCRKFRINICFVCKGNICRSPFAESYLKKILINKKSCEVNMESSGYYSEAMRRCPSEAVSAGQKFNVDLGQHRSSVLSEELISQNDMIFVFDIENWLVLREKFKRYKSKFFFLGSLSANSRIRIICDPYGQSERAFKDTYSSIVPLLESLADILSNNRKT
ncbi:MAG: arsenate reductase/protein-tyrosine-phosphatase family protein [Planctomycetota bacterium]|jgi:protein-tyrosine-phosphatase/predicted ATP-grasp superfamily ATP-dependent carboligase